MDCKPSTERANALLKQYATVVPRVTPASFIPAIDLLKSVLALSDIGSGLPLKGISNWQYRCYETFLLERGRFFRVPIELQSKQIPFSSRFEIAKKNQSPSRLYCEGFVIRTDESLVEHAWVYDTQTDVVVDEVLSGTVYFGVPFRPDFIQSWHHGNGIFSPANDTLLEFGIPLDAIWKPFNEG